MPAVDLALRFLPVAALVTSIIELGLTAYVAYVLNQPIPVYSFGAYGTRTSIQYVRYGVPSYVSFLIFCSLVGILVSAALILLPRLFAKRAFLTEKALGITILSVTTVTMILWLSAFAAYASSIFGLYGVGISGATMAFAVITWLIFLALTVLTFLTAYSVVKSQRLGYHPVLRQTTTTTTSPVAHSSMNPNNHAMQTGTTQGYPNAPQTYPDTTQVYPNNTQGYPNQAHGYPNNTQGYPDMTHAPNNQYNINNGAPYAPMPNHQTHIDAEKRV